MQGTETRPSPQPPLFEPGGSDLAAIVTDGRGLVCAVSSHLAELGLDASPERIGRHWTELFPSFRRLPASQDSGDDDFVVIIESTRTAFRVTRQPLLGGDEGEAGELLLLRAVEATNGETSGPSCHLDSLSELVASVAHEINNPLTTISGWMQIFLADAGPEDPIREQFASIQEELDRIAHIVEKLLDFAQKPSGATELLDVGELVRNITSFLEYQMKHANVAVATELSSRVGVVEGNRGELKQVFLNLMLNARQAMPEGGRLRVSTNVAPEGNFAEIRFQDTGHGVSSEAMERLFEPYYTTRADEGGSGIGLAVSRNIVRRLSGELEVEATSPAGSTFLVRLPLAGSA